MVRIPKAGFRLGETPGQRSRSLREDDARVQPCPHVLSEARPQDRETAVPVFCWDGTCSASWARSMPGARVNLCVRARVARVRLLLGRPRSGLALCPPRRPGQPSPAHTHAGLGVSPQHQWDSEDQDDPPDGPLERMAPSDTAPGGSRAGAEGRVQGCGVESGKNTCARLGPHWVPWKQGKLPWVVLDPSNPDLEMRLTKHY